MVSGIVIHLYENAHSGFYGPDNSATVDLLPKTWTRYTVTDGNWMTNETVNPLINRDIYLANKIDEVDEDKYNYYSAGKHIIIDKESNTISFNPFDIKYVFGDGLIYDEPSLYLDSDLPETYGGVQNKLKLVNNKICYSFTRIPESEQVSSYLDDSHSAAPQVTFNGGSTTSIPGNPTMIAVSKGFSSFCDKITSGEWKFGNYDYWDVDIQTRIVGFIDDPTNPEHDPEKYNPGPVSSETPEGEIDFDPTNRDTVEYEGGVFKKAGPNYLDVNINMCPQNNILYMW